MAAPRVLGWSNSTLSSYTRRYILASGELPALKVKLVSSLPDYGREFCRF